ncbi:cupin domain-containing protein [Alienimonas sp. DA493]|uniref:cupin domain-containing protein n=1 Tax=Alienimonas sp. DA493 TaxID=3373605 RepID=UPI003753EE8D
MSAPTVSADAAPAGPDGEKLLAAGDRVALRLWDEGPATGKGPHANDYETVGLALEGEATLTINGSETKLTPGLSWVVPAGTKHFYAVSGHFKAVEATSPPARS